MRFAGALVGVLALTLSLACSDDDAPPVEPVHGLAQFDARDYYEMLNGDLALPFEEAWAPTLQTAEEWRSLLKRQRHDGLESLTDDERKDLLAVAAKAYLVLVGDASIRYEVGSSEATVDEVYGVAPDLGIHYQLLERRARSEHILVELGSIFAGPADQTTERRFFLRDAESDSPYGEIWVLDNGHWMCGRDEDLDGYGLAMAVHRYGFTYLPFGEPTGRERLASRDVEVITLRGEFGSTYWLDVQTLWPIRKLETQMQHDGSTVSLSAEWTAINSGIEITPPGPSCDEAD